MPRGLRAAAPRRVPGFSDVGTPASDPLTRPSWSSDFVPGTVLSALHILTHLLLIIPLQRRYEKNHIRKYSKDSFKKNVIKENWAAVKK